MARAYHVYILTNRSGTLYVGVTNDVARRLHRHRKGHEGSFTFRYRIDRLVYLETYSDIRLAIAREKQIKGWVRRKKIALVTAANPTWRDLSPREP